MDFRAAIMKDLPQIKIVYNEIIKNMNDNQIQIWDDIYPCSFFEDDIKNNQLYILLDYDKIVSGFMLSETNAGSKSIKWNHSSDKVLYLDRFGVNVNYEGKGIGSLMLTKAKETARSLGAEYLRLFVIDINEPAIRLYIKNDFTRAAGIYDEKIDEGLVLHEYGYEIEL